jgi:hypothetical protein
MNSEREREYIEYSSTDSGIISATEEDKRKWTEHTGTYYVVNKLTSMVPEIWQLKVIHTTSNHGAEETVFYNIPADGKTSGTKFKYTTGPASPLDYWYMEGSHPFGPGASGFKTKTNFYCSVAAKDNGDVILTIHEDIDGQASYLEVEFNKSSGCKTYFEGR